MNVIAKIGCYFERSVVTLKQLSKVGLRERHTHTPPGDIMTLQFRVVMTDMSIKDSVRRFSVTVVFLQRLTEGHLYSQQPA